MAPLATIVAQELLTYRSFVHAVSGCVGGATAITLFYPLNTVRLRLQVDPSYKEQATFRVLAEIYRKEGFGGLYQGLHAQIIALACSNFVYFYTYEMFKSVYRISLSRKEIRSGPNLAIAATAGVINVFVTTPLWVAMSRLATQRKTRLSTHGSEGASPQLYTGVLDCLQRVVREEGVGALWNGVYPSLILVSNPTIQFFAYERCRRLFEAMALRQRRQITSLEFFAAGAFAKAIATFLTYPIQLAQSRLRTLNLRHADRKLARRTNTVSLLRNILAAKGIAGWFRGFGAKMWQTMLTAAFQFMVKEELFRTVVGALGGG